MQARIAKEIHTKEIKLIGGGDGEMIRGGAGCAFLIVKTFKLVIVYWLFQKSGAPIENEQLHV